MRKPWPTTSKGQARLNVILAWSWFFFGIYGLVDYLWLHQGIAQSIPVIFAISVYANFVGHLSTSEAAHEDRE